MKRIRVHMEVPYDVHIGRGMLERVHEATGHVKRRFVLTDTIVGPLYRPRLAFLDDAATFTVPASEESKNFATLERVLDAMVAAGLDRKCMLIALGGGVIGDLGGLAAALFQRGIAFVQVPTTLLAQVDSSVGGKTAVNLRAGKNLAGAFHQPASVYADTSTLMTVPDDEFRSGLGEVVKTALLDDERTLDLLETNSARILARDPDCLADVVESSVRTKSTLVARDPFEKRERKLLNLGHTFAHAIEHAAGFGRIPHGVAVAIGVVLAARASDSLGKLHDRALVARLVRLYGALGLPTSLAQLRHTYRTDLAPDALLGAMSRDKKSVAGKLRLVLPIAPGSVLYDVEFSREAMLELLGNESGSAAS